jgi:hypothetical protein
MYRSQLNYIAANRFLGLLENVCYRRAKCLHLCVDNYCPFSIVLLIAVFLLWKEDVSL